MPYLFILLSRIIPFELMKSEQFYHLVLSVGLIEKRDEEKLIKDRERSNHG
jgi:hypothetical protein